MLILADSRLAINTTLGVWAPRTNKAMVAANRRALAKLQARGIVVRLRYVRAHAGDFMNGRADALVREGAQTLRMRDGRLFTREQTCTLTKAITECRPRRRKGSPSTPCQISSVRV